MSKTVCGVENSRYQVKLLEIMDGQFIVVAVNYATANHYQSSPMSDYSLASHTFESKVLEFEGN